MSSRPTRDPYFRTCGGTDLQQETYWSIRNPDHGDYYFRFVELQDSAGGLTALIQDEVGYKGLYVDFFDHISVEAVTDPQELALAMLAIHG
jgi:hypothetical protein